MDFTQFTATSEDFRKFTGDILIFCFTQLDKLLPECEQTIKEKVERAFQLKDFVGKNGEYFLFYPEHHKKRSAIRAKRVAICGIGKITKDAVCCESRELLRKTGGCIATIAEKVKATRIMVRLPSLDSSDFQQTAECIAEGIALGDYRFHKYKKPDPEERKYRGLQEVHFSVDSEAVSAADCGMRKGENAAKATCLARDMANEPANKWTPESFAALGRTLAEKYAMKCTVLEKKDMLRLKMGGILAVNQGSSEPPKMVILEYKPKQDAPTLLLVGKGLTFDSGGISLKPAAGMEEMKYDMCGGAAVMALMQAVGEERPAVHIVAIIPATDNMSGSAAVKPGDVIHHYGGITAEIVNTDAEGRMILGDAMAYGIKHYKPVWVVDLATLTGAVIIGLGHHRTGLFSNNDNLAGRLIEAGDRCGEPLWRLPMGKEYTKQIESKIADMKNAGGREGGTITAAAYLEKFVGKTKWAHLDIAGTAWNFTEKSYIPKGPAGIGVRTLLELIRNWQELEGGQGTPGLE